MSARTAKWKDRGAQIVLNAARHLILPVANMLVAWLVMHYNGAEQWGAFVPDLILINLSVHILAWGNKEYLLRAFSERPAEAASKWASILMTRSLFLVVPIVLIFIFYANTAMSIWAIIWLFTAFLYNALDVVVLHTRGFRRAFIAELAALAAMLAILLWNGTSITELDLLKAFAIAAAIRAILTLSLVAGLGERNDPIQLDFSFFTAALPFFLIGFSGLLHSKTDLYLVNIFLPKEEIAVYQVLLSMLIYIQSIGAFLLMPFVRNLYRMGAENIKKISNRMMIVGLAVAILAVPALNFVMSVFYNTELPITVYLLAGLYILPIFVYMPYNYLLYKFGKERKVLIMNFLAAGVNAVLTLALLPLYGIAGALFGSMISQFFLLIWFEIERRKLKPDAVS